ncbi:hypothetical protein [Sphingomonas flavescens]|jgi:hypothetical protein|uniref:hypothetical protein n=1 Tax=Sphingomonas flavescens TaxID=3132797 RepID=UPI002805F9A7|nr:hypothetical protein [Sphingomonas limnosediminicola]
MMKRLMLGAASAATVLVGMTAFPTVATAQAGNRSITIYGNDPCPRDAICIRAPESQRYRLPQSQNPQGTPQERNSWANKSKSLMTVGATGVGSCSAVGPGGQTGCLIQEINRAKKDSREQYQADQAPQ